MNWQSILSTDPVAIAIPVFVISIIIELVAVRMGWRGDYDWRDTGTSLAMGLGNTISGALLAGSVTGLALWLWQHRMFDIPVAWWSFALCFLIEDLAYYWIHYNLSTALRQTWTGLFGLTFIIKLPLFFIGFPIEMVAFCGGLNLIYQFWIHTEVIGKMPRWFEAVMNTPSHHRVHHGTNPRYLDRNYAGVFIIWDKLFGTFEAERADEPPRYGIIRNLGTFNPLWVAVHEWVGIFRDVARARSLKNAFVAAFGPPGALSGETADALRAQWQSETAPPASLPPSAVPAE